MNGNWTPYSCSGSWNYWYAVLESSDGFCPYLMNAWAESIPVDAAGSCCVSSSGASASMVADFVVSGTPLTYTNTETYNTSESGLLVMDVWQEGVHAVV